ncbi:MAG: Stk1 family PASTA domain-containing Ser/Thr kinase [Tetrasphaera sp.]
MSADVPQLLGGRYEVGELIGRGGMAEVHLGYDTRLGRDVAIKILRSDHLRDPSFLARFRRETQLVAGLNHPAIVAVYDTGEELATESGGAEVSIPYIVMEYIDGSTVRELLRDRGTLTPHEAARITEGILTALDYSHRMGMVHRDIKPANIMITREGAVKVMDFGIARAMADGQATMTQTSSVLGTAQYISPEQAEGQAVDSRSDLYSTGCLLFELLTGRTPFVGEPVALTYQHVTKDPPLPSELNAAVPDSLDAIVLHALVKNRDLRYQDAESFRADLHAARMGLPISDAATHTLQRALAGPAPAPEPEPVAAPSAHDGNTATVTISHSYAEPSRRSRGGAIAMVLTLIAALAVLGVAGKAYLDSRPKQVTVPAVVSIPFETAKAKLELAGFDVARSDASSRTVQAGLVVKQEPDGNTSRREGSLVTLTVSSGPKVVSVPNVIGKSRTTAAKMLADAGLEIGTLTRTDSQEQKTGRVVLTEPAAYTQVHEGDTVNVTIASGRIDLPDLRGKTEDEARRILRDLDLDVTALTEISSQAEGTVIRQDPAAGQVPVQSTVTIVIAKAAPVTQTMTVTAPPPASSSSEGTSTGTSTDTGTLTSPPGGPPAAASPRLAPRTGGPGQPETLTGLIVLGPVLAGPVLALGLHRANRRRRGRPSRRH